MYFLQAVLIISSHDKNRLYQRMHFHVQLCTYFILQPMRNSVDNSRFEEGWVVLVIEHYILNSYRENHLKKILNKKM